MKLEKRKQDLVDLSCQFPTWPSGPAATNRTGQYYLVGEMTIAAT